MIFGGLPVGIEHGFPKTHIIAFRGICVEICGWDGRFGGPQAGDPGLGPHHAAEVPAAASRLKVLGCGSGESIPLWGFGVIIPVLSQIKYGCGELSSPSSSSM